MTRKIKNGELKENNLKKQCKHPKRFKNWNKINQFHKMNKKDKLKRFLIKSLLKMTKI